MSVTPILGFFSSLGTAWTAGRVLSYVFVGVIVVALLVQLAMLMVFGVASLFGLRRTKSTTAAQPAEPTVAELPAGRVPRKLVSAGGVR